MIETNKLQDALEVLPDRIRQQELEVAQAENEVELKKLKFDVAFGMALAGSKKPNATEKKYDALIISQEESKELIGAKYELAKRKAEFNFQTNEFIKLRKISSLREQTFKSDSSGF
jgi:hypothetical protein